MKPFRIMALSLLLFYPLSLQAQKMRSMDFRNQPIADILLALAEETDSSIIPDETVVGNASFYFSESTLEDALQLFLPAYKLFYQKDGSTYRVSRVSVSFDPAKKTVRMKADDVPIETLIRSLSRAIGVTILYDSLPRINLSVDIIDVPPTKAVEILSRRLTDYSVEEDGAYFYIKLNANQRGTNRRPGEGITKAGENYSLSISKARFLEVLADLFKKAGKEYSLLTKNDSQLENLFFSDRDFDSMLRLVLEQGNADYVIRDGVYYILELQRKDIIKKLKTTSQIRLSYLSAQEFPNLLPGELASGNAIKVDKATNSLIITGTQEETQPIIDFIAMVDRPISGMSYERFDIKYLKVKDLLAIIPQGMIPTPPLTIPGTNAFIVLGTPDSVRNLREYIAIVDRSVEGYPIRLKYIKTEELLKSLPPSVSKEEVLDSGYPNVCFFTGSEDKRRLFIRELATIDRPKPQIRYQLLVIQYDKNNSLTTGRNLKLNPKPDKSVWRAFSFVGELSKILTLNFDVINKFGYQFAATLNANLTEGSASIFADTTLHGLSGQDIKFQNTDTTRVQQTEKNDQGKETYTGVITEVSSGLIISLNGWVSGDNMITISVSATVSKQYTAEKTDDTGQKPLPSTSERIVNTQVRTPSGKAIIISGLIKEDISDSATKAFPILSRIPLLGLLFKDQTKSTNKTEIVIYIIPYLMRDDEESSDVNVRLERYYQTLVQGYLR